ncbi:putative NTPase (NACHT family) [Limihaloglobus sulfuriphilus]|uniref:Putative NTPase (NACHT family) n=1 Tax=Limihaloglobus sulfuriphilus TaxID=1851148 RepID=A0A1Q2MG08_9BACT|nr:hypothetical protein [Limihaloglobus sulfuriphilus]AQQ71237.1 putative NTPase (NACHT family) [Limihaloglobus sulfuriphilus]
MNKYIDLQLQERTKEFEKSVFLGNAISKNDVTILLGMPGSGKTSTLKKYEQDNEKNAEYITVKKLLKIQKDYKFNNKILLVDGLDEYRSISNDKTFVIQELAAELGKVGARQIVISCREMDWYGENDVKALKEEISGEIGIYKILPMGDEEKRNLAEIFNLNIAELTQKFGGTNLFDNPQMFCMLARIYNDSTNITINSKLDLYKEFFNNARETNEEYQHNNLNRISNEKFFEITGYLAAFYILSGRGKFTDDLIDEIESEPDGYSKSNIDIILKSKLFDNREFCHRTIAEYAFAHILKTERIDTGCQIDKERVKALFLHNKKIPTELRGTYAWLCCMTQDQFFYTVDPYYQAIHGDNSLFNCNLKEKIILAVKEHSKINPYFCQFYEGKPLAGFYEIGLDDFLISELKAAQEANSHYELFLLYILVDSSDCLSEKMVSYLTTKILSNKLNHPKYHIKAVIHKIEFLKKVLDGIRRGEIDDSSDSYKEQILKTLYPKHIGYSEIGKYVSLYNQEVIGYCFYLNDTPYDYKYEIVDDIYKNTYNEQLKKSVLPENVRDFVEHYFLETVLKYENGFDAQKIYDLFCHFQQYYLDYEGIQIARYKHRFEDMPGEDQVRFQRLANALFDLYVGNWINHEEDIVKLFRFDELFGYVSPTNQKDVFLKYLQYQDIALEKRNNLYRFYLGCISKSEQSQLDEARKIAKKYKLEDSFSNWFNPPKQEWEIERERKREERERKRREVKEKNEVAFREMTDHDVLADFGALHFIAMKCYFEHEPELDIERATFDRLKGLLGHIIYRKPISPEHTTLQSLAREATKANRAIDTVYHVSCVLNEEYRLGDIDDGLKEYLYVNCLIHRNTCNIAHGKFDDCIEKKQPIFAKTVLKDYLKLFIETYTPDLAFIEEYIDKEDELRVLKSLTTRFVVGKDSARELIIYRFVHIYNFNIKNDHLTRIVDSSKDNATVIAVKAITVIKEQKRSEFTIEMAIELYDLLKKSREEFKDKFNSLDRSVKLRLLDYMFLQFNTYRLIDFKGGIQTIRQQCATFLRQNSLNFLDLGELKELRKIHLENDIWKPLILHQISKLEQNEADVNYDAYEIEKIKNFMLSDAILSKSDFFMEMRKRISNIKKSIEGNRNNEKEFFYSSDGTSKNEESCRDVLLNILNLKYEKDVIATKEKYEAVNRVDINLKYKAELNFEIQIECKKDKNKDLYKGVKDQLIDKYILNKVEYGIYLVFYFGNRLNFKLMNTLLKKKIPNEYTDKVFIEIIDLRKN